MNLAFILSPLTSLNPSLIMVVHSYRATKTPATISLKVFKVADHESDIYFILPDIPEPIPDNGRTFVWSYRNAWNDSWTTNKWLYYYIINWFINWFTDWKKTNHTLLLLTADWLIAYDWLINHWLMTDCWLLLINWRRIRCCLIDCYWLID